MINRTALTCALALIAFDADAYAAVARDAAAPDTSMTLPGGSEGKTLDSITIEGEDRVHVRFTRPPLVLSLDPATAPGLDWESLWTVLAPESFDFTAPLFERSAVERAPYAPRPWLDEFRTGPVARFRPAVSGVETWKLEVADSRGQTVAHFDGKGNPPKEIAWDGRTSGKEPARVDLTYSYVLHATDKAGNKRSFVGDAFEIPPHLDGEKGALSMAFSVGLESGSVPEGFVMEAASRINEAGSTTAPVNVDVTAPTFALARAIADDVTGVLRTHLRGEPGRITANTRVESGAGERASVVIGTGAKPLPAATKSAGSK